MVKKKKSKTAANFGSVGGKALLKKRGKEYFSKLARRRWKKSPKKKVTR